MIGELIVAAFGVGCWAVGYVLGYRDGIKEGGRINRDVWREERLLRG